jgi:hypothetical protein
VCRVVGSAPVCVVPTVSEAGLGPPLFGHREEEEEGDRQHHHRGMEGNRLHLHSGVEGDYLHLQCELPNGCCSCFVLRIRPSKPDPIKPSKA